MALMLKGAVVFESSVVRYMAESVEKRAVRSELSGGIDHEFSVEG
jgi:hypothetical protein